MRSNANEGEFGTTESASTRGTLRVPAGSPLADHVALRMRLMLDGPSCVLMIPDVRHLHTPLAHWRDTLRQNATSNREWLVERQRYNDANCEMAPHLDTLDLTHI